MRFGPTDHRRVVVSRVACLVPALVLLALAGCGKTTKPAGPTTTFTGTATGPTFSGKLTVIIKAATVTAPTASFGNKAVVTATGTFVRPGNPDMPLAGEYDDFFKAYTLYGRDTGGLVWAFYGRQTTFGFRGTVDADTTFTDSTGSEGYNTVLRGSDAVTVILGTSNSTPPGDVRNFNLAFSGTETHGDAVATDTTGTSTSLDGTYDPVSGNIAIIKVANTGLPPTFVPTPATGTYDAATGTVTNGTYDDLAGHSGTWTGTKHP